MYLIRQFVFPHFDMTMTVVVIISNLRYPFYYSILKSNCFKCHMKNESLSYLSIDIYFVTLF